MTDRPNFLVFCTDQLASLSLGCNGNNEVATPHIDALARGGVTFRRAYCNNSVCMPSRSTMITGLTPRQHGCLTNGTLLPESTPTITQALADAGYRTHAVGKLHFQPFSPQPAEDEPVPSWESRALWESGRIQALPLPYYGFQTVDFVGGHVNYNFGDYANWLHRHHPGVHARYARENAYETTDVAWKMDVPAELHYNRWIADRTIAFLNREGGDRPFFAFCSFPDPHHPYAATRPHSEMYDPASLTVPPTWDLQREPVPWMAGLERPGDDFDERALREGMAQTYGMITHVDEEIGRVLAALEDGGLAEKTVVVLMADHGEYLGSHHLLYKGIWPWEPLMRVPFVWRAPDGAALPEGSEQVVSLLDFAPTVLDYAGVDFEVLNMRKLAHSENGPKSEWPGLPGRSLRSLIDTGNPLDERPAICEYDEDWKSSRMVRRRTIVTDRWKLSIFPKLGDGLLIDLREDPDEIRNLWGNADYAGIQANLTARLLEELVWSDRLTGPRICGA